VSWGVRPSQTAAHLGAKQGLNSNIKPSRKGSHIEASEVKHLLHGCGLKQTLKVGGSGLTQTDPHARDTILRISDLNQTKAIAAMDQTHGFGIDRKTGHLEISLRPRRIQVPIEHSELGRNGRRTGHGPSR
jgi:hypothetical protein